MKMKLRIIPLLASLLLFAGGLTAQITISGVVTADDEPLGIIGGTVLVKGTSEGTVTDFDGSYEVTVPDGEAVLVFSYTGYETQEILVGSQTKIDVVLAPSVSLLEEVVVVGYGTQKRSNISGAVGTVSADEITELPILRTEQALQGRTAGVQVVQNSGAPGAALTVRVRGIGTINNADPLYLVDGVPVEGIDHINPNDIASISVLKDAASAAIYGARGANGVVLITTKDGELNQKGTISYDGYYGVQNSWKTLNLLNAREYAILSNEAHIAAGQAPLPEFANPDALGEGTDWLDAIFQSAPIMSHNLGITGGNAKTNYAITGNYFTQDGIVGGDKAGFDRITTRAKVNSNVKDWLKVGANVTFTNLQRRFLPENNEFNTPVVRAMNMDPVTPIYKADSTFNYSRYSDTDITNPLNQIEQANDRWNAYRLIGSVYGEIEFLPGLTLRSTYSQDITFARQDIFIPRFDLSVDTMLSDAPPGEKNLINSVIFNQQTWNNWQFENWLTYDKFFGTDHHVTFNLGTTALYRRYDFVGGANTNLPSNNVDDAFIANTIDPIESQSAGTTASESSGFSVFGRVNYDLYDRYLLSATMRADGSSRFGANNRFGYFPSFSGGWVLSREAFWNIDAISFFKVRASWGQNGSDRIGDYSFSTVVLTGQNYTFGPAETITNGSVALVSANPDLQWETSTQTDFGIDLELWDGKFNLTTDYYIKVTSDMLYAAPVPFVAGTLPPVQNVATAENRGWEIGVQYRDRIGDFTYDVGGNISFYDNVVTGLGAGGEPVFAGNVQFANSPVSRTDVGQPMASFYGYVTDGLFQSQDEVEAHAFQSENTAPGDIRFV
ncbi:MAG: SusC/RagA family TonB-linked outer membrane protein, partial [Bacteroidota bacterium]